MLPANVVIEEKTFALGGSKPTLNFAKSIVEEFNNSINDIDEEPAKLVVNNAFTVLWPVKIQQRGNNWYLVREKSGVIEWEIEGSKITSLDFYAGHGV